jgi:hypothetical protein
MAMIIAMIERTTGLLYVVIGKKDNKEILNTSEAVLKANKQTSLQTNSFKVHAHA